jgi:hypothetical protein
MIITSASSGKTCSTFAVAGVVTVVWKPHYSMLQYRKMGLGREINNFFQTRQRDKIYSYLLVVE